MTIENAGPEEFLTHNGVTVCFTHPIVYSFNYTLKGSQKEFDVRFLPGYDPDEAGRPENYLDYHASIICAAIDSGDIPGLVTIHQYNQYQAHRWISENHPQLWADWYYRAGLALFQNDGDAERAADALAEGFAADLGTRLPSINWRTFAKMMARDINRELPWDAIQDMAQKRLIANTLNEGKIAIISSYPRYDNRDARLFPDGTSFLKACDRPEEAERILDELAEDDMDNECAYSARYPKGLEPSSKSRRVRDRDDDGFCPF